MHLTHNWMRAEPLDITLRRIKQFGYESIEISGEPTQYDTKETRALLKEHGIRCWGAVTLTLGERNLAAKDEGQRARLYANTAAAMQGVDEAIVNRALGHYDKISQAYGDGIRAARAALK